MRFRFYSVIAMALLLSLAAWPAAGQTTGTLTGRVIHEGSPLPGTMVTISSPGMQGTRTAYTDQNGNYTFGNLPPGTYTVRFAMEGMSTQTRTVRVALEQTARVDAALGISAVAEAITVTASAPAVVETTDITSNYDSETVDELPVGRAVNNIILLAPGTTSNGPRQAIQISGGFAHDNLIMVNGAVIQENLRGQTHNLFIEDAIQETTVMTGGISAEFGRFTGGVVNSITKSGGNEFSGSFRDSFTDPSWTDVTDFPGDEPSPSTLNEVYEATLGGRIIRDRLWFFTAGRYFSTTTQSGFRGYAGGGPDIFVDAEQLRWEGKLTGAITPRHSVTVSYLDAPIESTNNVQLGVWEPSGVDPAVSNPNDFLTARYNGIFTNNLLFEVGYAKKTFQFVGYGGEDTDLITGTPLVQWGGARGVANEPYFCGSCGPEARDNENLNVKATYYLGTANLGTHNLVAGWDDWMETRQANNYQSPTNFTVWLYAVPAVRNPDGSVTYTVVPGADTIEYFPIEFPSQGSDLTTTSFFVNDKWDLNQNFSFNLGARYDKNDAFDSFGQPVADDSAISPRLGLTFDPAGNGRMRFNLNYGKYVGRLAETVAGAGSPAGSPHFFLYYYGGPEFSGSAEAVVRQVMTWFNENGGINMPVDYASIGGVNTRIRGSLKAPGMTEFTGGLGMQVGSRGFFRVDYIDREWNDYYASFTNTSTGQVTEPRTGVVFDVTEVSNTDDLIREYQAVQAQAQFQALNWLQLGANYTYSILEGNAEGEGTAGGPASTGGWIFTYPEYQAFDRNAPFGYLSGDQTHKARFWASSTFALGPVGNLNLSLLHRFDSGTPYSAVGSVRVRAVPGQGAENPSGWAGIANPGYQTPPVTATYYFSDRGEFRLDNLQATDFAANYTLPIGPVALFVQAEVFNLFNNQSVTNEFVNATRVVSTTTYTWASGGTFCGGQRCAVFDPFNETPVEGVHYQRASNFGEALDPGAYQTPRTYQFSIGARF